MAKTETPAEVLESAQPPRPAQRVLSEPAPRVQPAPAAFLDVSPRVAARRALLQDAADTIVGRHHDLDAMDALDRDRLERDRLDTEEDAADPRDVADHGEPGRIFRPHAGQYDRSEDERAEVWSAHEPSDVRHEPGGSVGDDEPEPMLPRARAYLRREDYLRAEDLEAALLDDEDVLDEAEQAASIASAGYVSHAEHAVTEHPSAYDEVAAEIAAEEAAAAAAGCESASFGLPRVGARAGGRGAAKVPLATLEQPSSSRLELTPSPVPRVSLTPATGAVDISLVPGPNGSRNLPTLAAQHVLGRRQPRRPAAAVTLPPPNTTARESRVGMELATHVRSSKREVVLGLMIGLGLSVVLASVGQAYLRDPVIADGTSAPGELESITLSARPDAPDPSAGAIPAATAAQVGSAPGVQEPGSATPPLAASGADGSTSAPAARETRQSAPFAVAVNDDPEAALFAHARVPSRGAQQRAMRAAPQRSTRGLATRPRKSPVVAEPAAFEPARAPDRASDGKATEGGGAFESSSTPAPRTPLSPAESAGLGLDLPL